MAALGLLLKPITWTVKGATILTAAVTSPLWVPLVFFSTAAAAACLVPAAVTVGVGYFLWKTTEWKATLATIVGVLRAIRNELLPQPGLLHPEDTGPPKEPVDGPEAAKATGAPKVTLAEIPGHEEVTRAYIRPFSPPKEERKEQPTEPPTKQPTEQPPRRDEQEALVKRPLLVIQETKPAAPKSVAVDKNRVLQDLYYLEEFVGIKEPGAPPPPGSIDQQINEISKVVVGAPVPVKWPDNEDEKYKLAATEVLPALRDFIGV